MLESKSFLEKMTVLEHTIPFFLPIREAENDLLSSNAMVRLVALPFILVSSFIFCSACSNDICLCFAVSEIYRSCGGTLAGLCR